jgi:DNA replication protein DnaC
MEQKEPTPISNTIPVELKIQPQPLSELYSDIELTDEEKNEAIERALFEARYTKRARMNAEAYREKIMAPIEVKRYSAKQLFEFLKDTPGFDIDQDNEEVIKLLCLYFTNNPQFEQKGYNLQKGLLLFGGVGVGKTQLLSMFRNNQKHSYQVVSCQDVEGTYARAGDDQNEDTGEKGLKKYYGVVSLSGPNQYGQTTLGFLFDDLGQENIATKFYGTQRNVMHEVLTQRYKNGLFTSTHVTTNLSAEQIKELYGVRVADRMREMFNLISFPENAKSRRK